MNRIVELQDFIGMYKDPDEAQFDLQLLISMRGDQIPMFEPGRLMFTILECYKELVDSGDALSNWNFPEETADFSVDRLAWFIANK